MRLNRLRSLIPIQWSTASSLAHRDKNAQQKALIVVNNKECHARLVELAKEADRENLALLPKFHKACLAIVEEVKAVEAKLRPVLRISQRAEAKWSRHVDLATHVPFVKKLPYIVILVFGFFGEVVLSGKVFEGLDLPVLEKWLLAIGVVLFSTLSVKGIASLARKICDDWHDRLPLNKGNLVFAVLGCAALVGTLAGQAYARTAFMEASAALGEAAAPASSAAALTLLQGGIYSVLCAALYALLPHHRGEQARLNYLSARTQIDELNAKRTELLAQLNQLRMTLNADWYRRVALAYSIAVEYVQESANINNSVILDPAIDLVQHVPCMSIPDWVSNIAALSPADLQNQVEELAGFDANETAALDEHHLALIQQRAFAAKEPSHPAATVEPAMTETPTSDRVAPRLVA
jgi:hypothetical protein